jgi:hypothetical protein
MIPILLDILIALIEAPFALIGVIALFLMLAAWASQLEKPTTYSEFHKTHPKESNKPKQ